MTLDRSGFSLPTESMEFFKELPKVELHAHINGSIGHSLLQKLVEDFEAKRPNEISDDFVPILKKLQSNETEEMTLAECFLAFKCIHLVSGDENSVRQIVNDVISSFAADGVVYLELRTTPRAEPSSGMTKVSYLTTVLEEIRGMRSASTSIDVRLLVSIDRRKGVEDALDTLELVRRVGPEFGDLILGIDVSGDPSVGNLLDYVEALQEARRRGLKISVHLAEVPNENEVEAFLKAFLPDRIGHGTCLTAARGGSDVIEKLVLDNAIPLEICPSSNVISNTVAGYSDLHLKEWGLSRPHPVAVCTDDAGVFKTSSSNEYRLVAEHFALSQTRIRQMARKTVDIIFAEEATKTALRSIFDAVSV